MVSKRVTFCIAVTAAVMSLSSMARAKCTKVPIGNGSPALLSGTYDYNFSGGNFNYTGGASRMVGAGTIAFDGRGNVTGGTIHCNVVRGEFAAKIISGQYIVNKDGTGFMTLNMSAAVCAGLDGIDLDFGTTSGGAEILFASDGGGVCWLTGKDVVIAGTAERQ